MPRRKPWRAAVTTTASSIRCRRALFPTAVSTRQSECRKSSTTRPRAPSGSTSATASTIRTPLPISSVTSGSRNSPLFTFIITSATHLPYTNKYEPDVDVPGGGPSTGPEMSEYLRRLEMAQMDYNEFRAGLAKRFPNERFLIVDMAITSRSRRACCSGSTKALAPKT